MTLNTFPNTITQAWSVIKSPNWATRMQRSVSGRELRVSDYVNPIYTFTLTYEVLRDRWDLRAGAGVGPAFPYPGAFYDELRQIWQFFCAQQGSAIPFQFPDPSDSTTRVNPATPNLIQFAAGDGVTTSFQLVSPALRAPVIPVTVYSISPGGYSLDTDTGVISYGTAPGAGAAIEADMTYNYKVRFATDALEAENFMFQLWSMKQLKLVSVIE